MEKRNIHKHPLASRLTFLIVLFSIAITLIGLSLMLYRQYLNDLEALQNRIEFIETSSLPSLQNSLWEFNDSQVQSILQGLLKLEHVITAEVSSTTWDGKPVVFKAERKFIEKGRTLQQSFPIERRSNGKVTSIGELTITASLKDIYRNLFENAGFLLLSMLITSLLITAVILTLLRFLLTRHLTSIAEHARSLKLDEAYAPLILKRAEHDFPDELDEVVNALNHAHKSFLEEKKRELKAEKHKAWMEASTRAKSDFLSQMSHEIRTPMNGVIGLLELIDGENLTKEEQQHFEMIKRSGQSLLTIINDVLDFSKIEAGKLNIVQRSFSIESMVKECISLYTATAQEKNLKVDYAINLAFRSNVLGDPVRIKQVLLNLISNAIKYTEKGNIDISVESEYQLSEHKFMVRFSVKDTGIGIDDEYKKHIFGAFDQGDPLTNRQGTGLGLSISKKLIDVMGGSFGVESTLGEGSEFWFSIPLTQDKAIEVSPKPTPKVADINLNHPVLVAEDNAINIQVISGLLGKLNIEFETVNNGLEAFEKISEENNRYSVILMDSEMPIMDGFESTRKIRNFEKQHNMQPCTIVSLSAHFNEEHKQRCLKAGMDHHIAKPVTLNDLQLLLLQITGDDNQNS